MTASIPSIFSLCTQCPSFDKDAQTILAWHVFNVFFNKLGTLRKLSSHFWRRIKVSKFESWYFIRERFLQMINAKLFWLGGLETPFFCLLRVLIVGIETSICNLGKIPINTAFVTELSHLSCAVPLLCSFLILSILVTPNETLIFNFATSNSAPCLLVMPIVSRPYNIIRRAHGIMSLTHFPAHGIMSLRHWLHHWLNDIMPCAGKCVNDKMPCAQSGLSLVNLPLYADILLSQITPDTLLHPPHPACTWEWTKWTKQVSFCWCISMIQRTTVSL